MKPRKNAAPPRNSRELHENPAEMEYLEKNDAQHYDMTGPLLRRAVGVVSDVARLEGEIRGVLDAYAAVVSSGLDRWRPSVPASVLVVLVAPPLAPISTSFEVPASSCLGHISALVSLLAPDVAVTAYANGPRGPCDLHWDWKPLRSR
jgi:hypothetical protein